jgi:hypothetical protein
MFLAIFKWKQLICKATVAQKKNTMSGSFDFYSKYTDKNTFPAICSHALKMVSPFGSTHLCEQVFQG